MPLLQDIDLGRASVGPRTVTAPRTVLLLIVVLSFTVPVIAEPADRQTPGGDLLAGPAGLQPMWCCAPTICASRIAGRPSSNGRPNPPSNLHDHAATRRKLRCGRIRRAPPFQDEARGAALPARERLHRPQRGDPKTVRRAGFDRLRSAERGGSANRHTLGAPHSRPGARASGSKIPWAGCHPRLLRPRLGPGEPPGPCGGPEDARGRRDGIPPGDRSPRSGDRQHRRAAGRPPRRCCGRLFSESRAGWTCRRATSRFAYRSKAPPASEAGPS